MKPIKRRQKKKKIKEKQTNITKISVILSLLDTKTTKCMQNTQDVETNYQKRVLSVLLSLGNKTLKRVNSAL